MASVFKQKYTVTGKNGKKVTKKSKYWYVDYKTADGTRKRVKGFKDKTATAQLAVELEREAELASRGIVDKYKEHRNRPLSEHLEDFWHSLGDTKHGRHTYHTVQKILDACGFRVWNDIQASKVWSYLKRQKANKEISDRTFCFRLKAVKQFCKWMVEDQRAVESPVTHLKAEAIVERERERRALGPEELRRLLHVTVSAPRRFGMDGLSRALLYRLAAETGLRRGELASLSVSSIDFENNSLSVKPKDTKNKKTATVPLRSDTVACFREHTATRLPSALLFNVPDKTAKMLYADLELAGIPVEDEQGRVVDFHALRHTAGTLLAASGAHPKVAQTIMRHSDINLTMGLYTHILRGQESQAIENLPDLSWQMEETQKATGTDDSTRAYKKLTKKPVSGRNRLSSNGNRTGPVSNRKRPTGKTHKGSHNKTLDNKKGRMSSSDSDPDSSGRCRIRTYDRLIKSQLLCQLS